MFMLTLSCENCMHSTFRKCAMCNTNCLSSTGNLKCLKLLVVRLWHPRNGMTKDVNRSILLFIVTATLQNIVRGQPNSTVAICPCSSRFSLSSLYPLRHSCDLSDQALYVKVLQARVQRSLIIHATVESLGTRLVNTGAAQSFYSKLCFHGPAMTWLTIHEKPKAATNPLHCCNTNRTVGLHCIWTGGLEPAEGRRGNTSPTKRSEYSQPQ